MKHSKNKLVHERMQILADNANHFAVKNYTLAEKQAELIKKLSTKHKIPIPYHIRIQFCKKCKKFIVPGLHSRIRTGRSNTKAIRITCLFCSHTYHKVISSP